MDVSYHHQCMHHFIFFGADAYDTSVPCLFLVRGVDEQSVVVVFWGGVGNNSNNSSAWVWASIGFGDDYHIIIVRIDITVLLYEYQVPASSLLYDWLDPPIPIHRHSYTHIHKYIHTRVSIATLEIVL